MKRFVSSAVSAGLILAAAAANAQMPAPYRAASDFDSPYERPYGAVPPTPPPAYGYGSYAPALLPLPEVYAVLRDNGFSPLSAPYQRGFVYIVAVVDRNGEDGRLVIDARNGRIIRFMPVFGPNWGNHPYGGNFVPEPMGYEGDVALPRPIVIRGVPRPPAPIPHVASRPVPLPAPKPATAARPAEPAQQSAAIETRPATPPPAALSAPPPAQANASPPANTTIGEAKPVPAIRPTQPMPAAQGLE